MPRFALDVRLAFRSLLRRPGYALVALATLALGIGATTAIYTVVHSVLLEPLPYPEPERLMVVLEKNPEAGFPRFSLSPLNFRDYRAEATVFESFAASTGVSLALEPPAGGPARRLIGRRVTWEYLDVAGVPPAVGRGFAESDDQPGADPVVVLSHGAWTDLGADPAIVGSSLRIDGRPTEVIGVMPAGYVPHVDAYVPLAVAYEETPRGGHWLSGVARLADGRTLEEARAELDAIAARLEAAYPDSNTGWGSLVLPLHELQVEDSRAALWLLLGAVGVVLLLSCANVAHLTLVRLAEREREIALRSALGAGRGQVIRQLLVEGLVLALAGGSLGLLVARYATERLVGIHADAIPRAAEIAVDGGVLLFALGVSLLSVLVFGLVPALQASRPDLAGTLKEGGRGFAGGVGGGRLRGALVLFQVASAVVLAVGAGLLVRSLQELSDVDPGFRSEGVWTARLALPESEYGEEEQQIAFYRRLDEELASIPGVESAGSMMPMPLSGGNYILQFFVEGRPFPAPNQEPNSPIRFVLPGTFDALGIPLQTGRLLSPADGAEGPFAVVISRTAAERFWPGQDPLGERITFGDPRDEEADDWYTVVGVVGDVRHDGLGEPVEPAFYLSVFQSPQDYATLVLRTSGEPSRLAASVRAVIERLDPALALWAEQPAEAYVRESTASPRFLTALLGSFAVLAVLLALIGVFGVVSYGVAQGLREIGIRLALGSGAGRVARYVLAQGLRPVGIGVVLGLFGAVAASRFLASQVYGVGVTDPATYAAVAVGVVLAGTAACLVPTLRAIRVDPASVLRDE